MKSRWVFHHLKTHLVSSISSTLYRARAFTSRVLTSHNTDPNGFALDHVQLSLHLSSCGREGDLHLGTSLHALIIKNFHYYDPRISYDSRNAVVVWNSLLGMYAKSRALPDAVKVFDGMPVRDTVSWNTVISGFLGNGEFCSGIWVFKRMCESGVDLIDQATFTTVLSGCDGAGLLGMSMMIHGLALVCGYEGEVTVGNALITSYFRCGCCEDGKKVFGEMDGKNVVTWTAAISGLAQNEMYEDSLKLFAEMCSKGSVSPNCLTYLSSLSACAGLQALRGGGDQIHGIVWKLGFHSDYRIESALMDMYSKCGCMEDAMKIFHSSTNLDEVSMTVILVGCAQNGLEEEAVHIFKKILKFGSIDHVDANIVSAIFGVFGSAAAASLAFGQQIHSLVIKKNFGSNPFVTNGLINMYSKCGHLEESSKIFRRMMPNRKNSVSWNSMIAAFARHGDGLKVLQMYEEMLSSSSEEGGGAQPTDVTFLSLLHACSHMGLVEKGTKYLDSMSKVHGLRPRMEHYACVVDMLGRAGLLNEAKFFVEKLPVTPGTATLVWQALLGASRIRGDLEMAKYAAEQLFLVDPDSPAPYIQLANIYSSERRWRERAGTIKRMKEKGMSKETGISWVEIDKKVHSFVVWDRMHQEADIIYTALAWLLGHMTDEEGYDTRWTTIVDG
ncbi:hypothetical protein Dimus_021714 [Dionaea muscipula]